MNGFLSQNEQVNVSFGIVWQGGAGKMIPPMSEVGLDGCFIDNMGQEILGETINFKVRIPSRVWVSLICYKTPMSAGFFSI
jgi:hypothetical protein